MTRIKSRSAITPEPSKRGKNYPTTRAGRVPVPVQPTPEQLLRRAEALGIDIKLGTDPKTGKLVWDNSHDLTAAVDALAVYRATKVHSRRQEPRGGCMPWAGGRRSGACFRSARFWRAWWRGFSAPGNAKVADAIDAAMAKRAGVTRTFIIDKLAKIARAVEHRLRIHAAQFWSLRSLTRPHSVRW